MTKKFETFGVMIDFSRNAVMTVETLKSYMRLLKKMGYNTLFLYTEDTYEIEGEPYFGYLRGRYSIDEMREIDEYAASLGIEAIPCIQTLAHLQTFLFWNKVQTDYGDIMLTDDERTYELIDKMFATLKKCFRTRRIHIGMDEAHMLGRGKHLDLFGYESAHSVLERHLKKVNEIAKTHGYEIMIWSDMFFRSWNDGLYYTEGKVELSDEIKNGLPEGVIPVYWDYYHDDEQIYDDMFYNHAQISKNTWFGGGLWSWQGHMPHNEYSIRTMKPAIRSCKKNKIKNVFMTMWGDCGGECSHFSQLPALFYVAEYARGNEDEALIKAKFKRAFGVEFDDFMKLDLLNIVKDEVTGPINPSKYMLYSDYFNGFLDVMVVDGGAERYAKYAEELRAVAKKTRKYGYLFKTAAKLAEILAIKYDLGKRTREAYKANDVATLLSLANNDYKKLEKLIAEFTDIYEAQWFLENKPHGFDVQDIRLGALLRRTTACKKRLLAYCNGKISSIPELEEELLPYVPYDENDSVAAYNSYVRYTTVNRI